MEKSRALPGAVRRVEGKAGVLRRVTEELFDNNGEANGNGWISRGESWALAWKWDAAGEIVDMGLLEGDREKDSGDVRGAGAGIWATGMTEFALAEDNDVDMMIEDNEEEVSLELGGVSVSVEGVDEEYEVTAASGGVWSWICV